MKHRRSVVGVVLGCALSGAAAFAEEGAPSPLTAAELQQYRELSRRIQADYVDPVDDKRLFNACLVGMSHLDPHSDYLDAAALKAMKTGSGIAGVGLELGIKNNRATVISAIEDSPASKAGIRRGDTLFKIDGEPVVDLSLVKVVDALRGAADSKVRLTILREGSPEPVNFELTRKVIKLSTVKSKMLEPGYAYVKISAFYDETIEKFVAAMQALDKPGELKGLVLDLRNNPGGLFAGSMALASVFLPDGAELLNVTERRYGKPVTVQYNDRDLRRSDARALNSYPSGIKRLKTIPLVVLVNNGSAAGVEIVAGALQDYRRALIIGTPTFGKDSIQTLIPLGDEPEETALKLTTARWHTPKGRSSFPSGIAPDILVEVTASPDADDTALDRALRALKEQNAAH
ncbi:MAG: S41 family peptidase [Gallionella sp.]|nr:S41 family peptidase [Gallionella sp.]